MTDFLIVTAAVVVGSSIGATAGCIALLYFLFK